LTAAGALYGRADTKVNAQWVMALIVESLARSAKVHRMTSQDEGRNRQHWVAIAEDVFSPAAAWRGQRFSVFLRGAQGELLLREREGERWTAIRSLGVPTARMGRVEAPMPVDWPVSACATGGDRVELLARGPEGGLDGRGGDLPIAGAISAAACGRRRMSIFARSTSGELLIKAWNGSGWSPFAPVRAPEELDPMYPTLQGLVPLSSAPVAGGGGTSRLDVFARGPTGSCTTRPRSSLRGTC
jgi:hypothetical protein